MTFSPKVWGDALRQLQQHIPDFVFDAWIAPLEAKLAGDRIVLGCTTSFHRDRIRNNHLPAIKQALAAAGATSTDPRQLCAARPSCAVSAAAHIKPHMALPPTGGTARTLALARRY